MTDLLKRLAHCAQQKTALMIKYSGGSQPGTNRQVMPLIITETHLRAREIATNRTKTFALKKIEIVDEGSSGAEYKPTAKIDNQTTDLSRVFIGEVEGLKNLGWEVRLTEESIKLYVRSQTGKIKKEATIGLQRNYDQVLTITLDGGSSSMAPSSDRPWYVFDPDYQQSLVEREPEAGRSYKYLSQAMRVFFDQARRHAPKREAR